MPNRIQNALGGKMISRKQRDSFTKGISTFLLYGIVVDVNTAVQKVKIETPIGTGWASVMKPKASELSSEIDYPHKGDIAIVSFMNGDMKSYIVLGFIENESPTRTILTDENKEEGNVEEVKNKLYDRYYWKHESKTFVLVNKIGSALIKFFKKATPTADPKPNLQVNVMSDGTVQLLHYRGADKNSIKVKADNNGNLSLILYKDDGTTPAFDTQIDKDGNITQVIKGNVGQTINGTLTATVTGNATIQAARIKTIGLTDLDNEENVLAGCVTGQSMCPFTGLQHFDISSRVRAKK